MESGSISFIMISTALVFLMTPALAFFYGGLVRRKNVLNTMMACMFTTGICVLVWFGLGFSLSFGSDHAAVIGGFDFVGFHNVSINESTLGLGIPDALFAVFQMMFAVITPALITGSVTGRMSFKALIPFIILWLLIVYCPLAHMVWGGGLIAQLGAIDFAGGDVVHISAGVTGLVLAILLKKRRDYDNATYKPHNIPYVLLGASLLWFGWYGFNAGSALHSGDLAVHAFITTTLSAAAALTSWMLIDFIRSGRPTAVGCGSGIVVGLVAITPACGFVSYWAAVVIGLLASPLCYFGIRLVKSILKIDDSLDAFGCHGIGGIWGGIATGLFGQKVLPNGIETIAQWNGLIFGEGKLFLAQIEGIAVTIVIAVVGTLVCAAIVRTFTKLRVGEMDEKIGLDRTQHGESAYPSFNGLD
ncbi:Ammonium transporter [anaerobic digester metagenome]